MYCLLAPLESDPESQTWIAVIYWGAGLFGCFQEKRVRKPVLGVLMSRLLLGAPGAHLLGFLDDGITLSQHHRRQGERKLQY